MQPRAFVAMPYGQKKIRVGDKEILVDFDAVYNELIQPALEQSNLQSFRADEEPAAGDIRIDMFFELVTADIVIADVSGQNTNVFYELGIRHGVSARGVFLVHGGWNALPFDNAPDRTLRYDGRLFEVSAAANDASTDPTNAKLADLRRHEADRLARKLNDAVSADETTIGSPVYAQVPGLKPPDIAGIQTARSRYYGSLQDDWAARVRIARRQRRPEDILTLAESAPTRFQHDRMVFDAARALMEVQRFQPARELFADLLRRQPDNVEVTCQLALAMGRMGKVDEAAEQVARVAAKFDENAEVQGTLGRAFKDMWRLRWEDPKAGDRCELAVRYRAYAEDAIARYRRAHQGQPQSYYNGINFLTLHCLLGHAVERTAATPQRDSLETLGDVIAAVRFAASAAHAQAGETGRTEDLIWTAGTLGELAVVTGDDEAAREWYEKAAYTRDVTHFQISSMIGQLELFQKLGRSVGIVGAVLEQLGTVLTPTPEFKHVVVAGWPQTRSPGSPAFEGDQKTLGELIVSRLAQWRITDHWLAICAPYTAADLVFAEACRARGATVRLLIPVPEAQFIGQYLRDTDGSLTDRFLALTSDAHVEVRSQPDHFGPLRGMMAEARNELWMINTARAEAKVNTLYTVLWGKEPAKNEKTDEKASFAHRMNMLGGRRAYLPGV